MGGAAAMLMFVHGQPDFFIEMTMLVAVLFSMGFISFTNGFCAKKELGRHGLCWGIGSLVVMVGLSCFFWIYGFFDMLSPAIGDSVSDCTFVRVLGTLILAAFAGGFGSFALLAVMPKKPAL